MTDSFEEYIPGVKHTWISLFIILLTVTSLGITNTYGQSGSLSQADSSEVVEVLTRFREAVIEGDRLTASKEMTQQAVVLQAGVDERKIRQHGNVIWVSTSYMVDVTHQDEKPVHRKLAELAVLKKEDNQWRIDMIHWSDCPRYPE